jgi:hypothetical protein
MPNGGTKLNFLHNEVIQAALSQTVNIIQIYTIRCKFKRLFVFINVLHGKMILISIKPFSENQYRAVLTSCNLQLVDFEVFFYLKFAIIFVLCFSQVSTC